MAKQLLTIRAIKMQDGQVILTYIGEMSRSIATPVLSTTYYMPTSTPEGTDWVSAAEWGNKNFMVYADTQPVEIDVLNSEDGINFYKVANLSIASGAFVTGSWNTIETTLPLNLVQLKIITQGTAPVTLVGQLRFVKQ